MLPLTVELMTYTSRATTYRGCVPSKGIPLWRPLLRMPRWVFALWFLSLSRQDKRVQKVWTNLVEDWPRRGGRASSLRVTSFAQSLWTCFTSMKRWSNGVLAKSSCAATMVDRRLEDLSGSKAEATIVAGTGLVLPRKENIAQAAMEFAHTIVHLVTKHCIVLRIDNYNKWRYNRDVCR